MAVPQFADISGYQGNINWQEYKAWAASFDGVSRVSIKSSEGSGFTDPRFYLNRAGAIAAGIDIIIIYHYARPDLGNSAGQEADWQTIVTGPLRKNDILMLDYEVQTPQATADWAYQWLARQQTKYGKSPTLYASDGYIRAHLQDGRLAKFPLTLANWEYTPDERPPCPPPWKNYMYLQFSDRASVPGIPTLVDCNVYLGASTPVKDQPMNLQNFPMVSQLTTVTGDGRPSENAQMDCVAASVDALCRYVLGTPENSTFNPDTFKDKAYGEAYTGGTSASAYVPFCQSLGVNLHAINSTNAAATIKQARLLIQQGHPAIFTILDPYVNTNLPQYAGWTHVCVFYGADNTGLTAMDPYIAKPVYQTDAHWIDVLRSHQLWIAETIIKDNPHMDTQFSDVWFSGPLHLPDTTGIATFVKAAFKKGLVSACYPLQAEVHTVDWEGSSIQWQSFSNGLHAEFNNVSHHTALYDAENHLIA